MPSTGGIPANTEEELEMAVTQLMRWNGGTRDSLIDLGKQAKALWEKAGAESFRVAQIHTGPNVGQWLVAVRFPDWAAYGKAMQSLASDAAYRKFLAEVGAISELVDRTVVVGIDL
jgi:hypothetical protein